MSATCALGEIMELPEMEQVVLDNYSQIYCSLLLRFGTTRFSKDGRPSEQIIATFKKFIQCAKQDQLFEALKDDHWKQLASNDKVCVSLYLSVCACGLTRWPWSTHSVSFLSVPLCHHRSDARRVQDQPRRLECVLRVLVAVPARQLYGTAHYHGDCVRRDDQPLEGRQGAVAEPHQQPPDDHGR